MTIKANLITNDTELPNKRGKIFWAVAPYDKKKVDGKMISQKGIERYMCESSS